MSKRTAQLSDDPLLVIDKGPAGINMRHRLSIATVFQLPVGKGRRFALSGPADWVLGNWQLSAIATFETGLPADVSYGIDNLGGAGTTRPNMVCDRNSGPKTPFEWFSKSCFTAPTPIAEIVAMKLDPLLAAWNAGRGVIRGPGYNNWDIGIFKSFPITERYRVQFRAEMYNAFNHVNWGGPVTSFLSPSFGQILGAADGRQIQFGLKLNF